MCFFYKLLKYVVTFKYNPSLLASLLLLHNKEGAGGLAIQPSHIV